MRWAPTPATRSAFESCCVVGNIGRFSTLIAWRYPNRAWRLSKSPDASWPRDIEIALVFDIEFVYSSPGEISSVLGELPGRLSGASQRWGVLGISSCAHVHCEMNCALCCMQKRACKRARCI